MKNLKIYALLLTLSTGNSIISQEAPIYDSEDTCPNKTVWTYDLASKSPVCCPACTGKNPIALVVRVPNGSTQFNTTEFNPFCVCSNNEKHPIGLSEKSLNFLAEMNSIASLKDANEVIENIKSEHNSK